MKNAKKSAVLPILAMLVVAGSFFFFIYRMGTNDVKALADFPVAYNNYDQAITDYSKAVLEADPEYIPNVDDLLRKANEALAVLRTKASARISSLTKNDGDLMNASQGIAALAVKELDTLMTYRNAAGVNSADMDQLENQFRDLASQRQAYYAYYLELARIKK